MIFVPEKYTMSEVLMESQHASFVSLVPFLPCSLKGRIACFGHTKALEKPIGINFLRAEMIVIDVDAGVDRSHHGVRPPIGRGG